MARVSAGDGRSSESRRIRTATKAWAEPLGGWAVLSIKQKAIVTALVEVTLKLEDTRKADLARGAVVWRKKTVATLRKEQMSLVRMLDDAKPKQEPPMTLADYLASKKVG